eukprot:Blabericola_migrator_1__7430@NODE_378_length_9209_cov_129_909101_g302_i0_p7_GENE_NODE_378_length_9209_cov_129_909101_g302_i0NODE_378_length_9209_cov_129_909101_g302_i0_p7_ORF_typecomplete_len146_score33_69Ribosomal_L27e/PF01777_18/4_4e22Peptidase_A2B/PF12384_8/0_21_NODE_378_length_9209_cov_129_909101_g302_i051775614
MAQIKVFKQGRIAVILAGRQAGKKAVVLTAYDQGTRQRAFGHALVLGIENGPHKITKKMNAAQVEKRSKVKCFLKYVNYSHMMPTRYVVPDIDAKTMIGECTIETAEDKKKLMKSMSAQLLQKFTASEDPKTARDLLFFRRKLRF